MKLRRKAIQGGLIGMTHCWMVIMRSAGAAEEPFDEARLVREPLAAGLHDAIQLSVATDGEVFFIERAGKVKCYSPKVQAVREIGSLAVALGGEYGLIGLALAPDFQRSRQIYVTYAPLLDRGKGIRLSRFTLGPDGLLDLNSEKVILRYAITSFGHQGGGLVFDEAGNLWMGIGDDSHANVTPETDERPGRENFNALRTSANSQDLRGKILRISPQSDGTYSIPPGNLFVDPKQGRPEIYVMGCRNPYRFWFDAKSGALYWGDVGSNTEDRFGTGGYDEFTRTTRPGNGGWPLFIGPNTAYRDFKHGSALLGDPFDPNRPLNASRLNTGSVELPNPIPAMIWYGSGDSREFPELGNGGRSALAGPVYRFDRGLASDVKLPAHFDGRFFIADWCRAWIKSVVLSPEGGVSAIEPFLGRQIFNRPIDLKFGPDGALYLLEFGSKWAGNTDGALSRIVYQRGNRPPVAVANVDVVAGAAPLKVRFDAAGSSDPDGDTLSYAWEFGEKGARTEGTAATWTYLEKGVRTATLVVTDAYGSTQRASVTITVGNAQPKIIVETPAHGVFFDWGEKIPFRIRVTDAEDGSTDDGSILPQAPEVTWLYRDELVRTDGSGLSLGIEGGAARMRRSDCLSCHQVAGPSVGPSFLAISERYRDIAGAEARLREKVRTGGAGAWGEVPMPPHPQNSADDVAKMIDYVLKLRTPSDGEVIHALRGELAVREGPRNAMHEKNAGGSYRLRVRYRDRGADDVPALTVEKDVILHARRTRAALFDASAGATVMEVSTLKRDRRICAQLQPGGHLKFSAVNLAGIAQIACEVSAGAGHGGVLEIRVDQPDGPLIGEAVVPETGEWENWLKVIAHVHDPGGVRDLFVSARAVEGAKTGRFNVDVLEFVPFGGKSTKGGAR